MIVVNCKATRDAERARGAIASVACRPAANVVDKVWYELFENRADANAYYEDGRRGVGAPRGSGGNCRTKAGEGAWNIDENNG